MNRQMKYLKSLLKFLTSRLFMFAISVLIQLCILIFPLMFLSGSSGYFYIGFTVVGVVLSCLIMNRNINPMYKLAWIVPVLVFPFLGCTLYMLFGRGKLSKKVYRRMEVVHNAEKGVLDDYPDAVSALEKEDINAARQARYITSTSNTNVYINTQTEYLSPGEVFFERLVEELKKAEHFIFLEYFIIREGIMWNTVLNILTEKVKQGVEVRLMYDDMGTINYLPKNYHKILNSLGIKLCLFNPVKPSLDAFLNYRDHRKITVVDGKCAFTGGINLADEYINQEERFGHWKDSSVVIYGDAVNRITKMFLSLWHFSTGDEPDYNAYITEYHMPNDGYVIPYGDDPLDKHLVSELAYINMINTASRSIYITTPYLIIDNEMLTALTLAARSGVDVRIMTPHVADKKIVFMVTRANYEALIEGGVKIYEYTPGFMHSKSIVVDDKFAIIGSTNFDYRSFYLHFENGVWMYKSKCVLQVKEDCLDILSKSQEITIEMCRSTSKVRQFIQGLVKFFSPIM